MIFHRHDCAGTLATRKQKTVIYSEREPLETLRTLPFLLLRRRRFSPVVWRSAGSALALDRGREIWEWEGLLCPISSRSSWFRWRPSSGSPSRSFSGCLSPRFSSRRRGKRRRRRTIRMGLETTLSRRRKRAPTSITSSSSAPKSRKPSPKVVIDFSCWSMFLKNF